MGSTHDPLRYLVHTYGHLIKCCLSPTQASYSHSHVDRNARHNSNGSITSTMQSVYDRCRHFITMMVLTMQHCKLYFTNLTVRFHCCVGLRCTLFVTFLFSFNFVFNLLYYLFDKINYYIIVIIIFKV